MHIEFSIQCRNYRLCQIYLFRLTLFIVFCIFVFVLITFQFS